MGFTERVMRVMTHVHIGVALGLAAWVLWSGWLVATGQITPADRLAEVKAQPSLAHAIEPVRMRLVPMDTMTGTLQPCHEAAPSPPADLVLTGADL
jgi:hypothetical protein